MGVYSKETKSFVKVEAGNHSAICFAVVDMGQQSSEYEGKKTFVNKVALGFRLETDRVFWTIYTNSLHEKSRLRKVLEIWRNKKFTPEELNGFDLSRLIGVSTTATLEEKDQYLNITELKPPTKKLELYPNESIMYDGTEKGVLGRLPRWLREKCLDSGSHPSEATTDDLPF